MKLDEQGQAVPLPERPHCGRTSKSTSPTQPLCLLRSGSGPHPAGHPAPAPDELGSATLSGPAFAAAQLGQRLACLHAFTPPYASTLDTGGCRILPK